MAEKKGKSRSAKVPGLKSMKLSADQAGQVKGGLGIELGHKDIVASRPGGIKLPGDQMSGDFHIKFNGRI